MRINHKTHTTNSIIPAKASRHSDFKSLTCHISPISCGNRNISLIKNFRPRPRMKNGFIFPRILHRLVSRRALRLVSMQ